MKSQSLTGDWLRNARMQFDSRAKALAVARLEVSLDAEASVSVAHIPQTFFVLVLSLVEMGTWDKTYRVCADLGKTYLSRRFYIRLHGGYWFLTHFQMNIACKTDLRSMRSGV